MPSFAEKQFKQELGAGVGYSQSAIGPKLLHHLLQRWKKSPSISDI